MSDPLLSRRHSRMHQVRFACEIERVREAYHWGDASRVGTSGFHIRLSLVCRKSVQNAAFHLHAMEYKDHLLFLLGPKARYMYVHLRVQYTYTCIHGHGVLLAIRNH
jgi:hypothetical protein